MSKNKPTPKPVVVPPEASLLINRVDDMISKSRAAKDGPYMMVPLAEWRQMKYQYDKARDERNGPRG